MKKTLAMILAVLMLAAMTACAAPGREDGKYVIGICQMMKHSSLNEASKGFMDTVTAALGEENVEFLHQDAGGEYAACATIVDGFVAENVDLILANATVPLQAAVSATGDIPILGTSVTDYAAALNMTEWTGTVGRNVSGTTDLAPLERQAEVIRELFPDARNVGLFYCSGEPNSVYQIDAMEDYLTDMGYACTRYAFTDVNDLPLVCQRACDSSDVIYIPTDNTCAAYPQAIANVVLPAGVPVVTGDASTCAAAGVATFSISYYELGCKTGEMAVEVLTGGADISAMAVRSAGEAIKMYNPAICELLGVHVPAGYEAVENPEE